MLDCESVFKILGKISQVLLFITLIFGTIKFKKFPVELKLFYLFLIFMLFIEITTSLLSNLGINNLIFYPIYYIGEFDILFFMFSRIIKISTSWKLTCLGLLIALILESVFRFYNGQELTASWGKPIANIAIICMCCIALLKQVQHVVKEKQNPTTNIISVLLFYYCTSIFIFILLNQLIITDLNIFYSLWSVNIILSIVVYMVSLRTFIKIK